MEIVADTNIIAAAILRNGPTRNFLFSQSLRVFSPDYLNEELAEHEKEFERKSGLSRKRFMQAKELVLSQLMEIPK